jgi:hypothetical protein
MARNKAAFARTKYFLDAALHIESLFGNICRVCLHNFLESAHGVFHLDILCQGLPVNVSATWNGWDRKRWILRAR